MTNLLNLEECKVCDKKDILQKEQNARHLDECYLVRLETRDNLKPLNNLRLNNYKYITQGYIRVMF